MLLQMRRYDRSGLSPNKSYLPRLGWMLVFGLLHAYLIWHGDILVAYAFVGLVIFFCRNWSAKWQAIIGVSIQLGSILLFSLVLAGVFLLSGSAESEWFSEENYEGFWSGESLAGGWLQQLPYRATVAAVMQIVFIPFVALPFCGSLMLVGMALYRSGFFEHRWAKKHYYLALLTSVGIGLPLVILGGAVCFLPDSPLRLNGYSPLYILATPFIMFAYAIVVVLWSRTSLLNFAQVGLRSVGRMAFSNYLGQSILFSLIFYGHGLGLVDKLSLLQVVGIAASVWGFQLLFSTIWLHCFKLGPLEWVWRWLVKKSQERLRA